MNPENIIDTANLFFQQFKTYTLSRLDHPQCLTKEREFSELSSKHTPISRSARFKQFLEKNGIKYLEYETD